MLLCGPLPLIWYVLGIIILKYYPIDQAFYQRILSQRSDS